MSKQINATEYPLSKIFSSEFQFKIPKYQRPYSWTKEHTSELFDDLYKFHNGELDDNYFLGSIVLIKDDDKPFADVVDGQQRLTTLTILLAALASISSEDNKKELAEYILQPKKDLEKLEAVPRLSLRQKDNDFFNKYVQSFKLEDLFVLDDDHLKNEAQKNIKHNGKLLLEMLKFEFGNDAKLLQDFSSFLMTRCYLVVVSTPDQNSAFRIFSVLNSRGMDLIHPDIIKADTIGNIQEDKQKEFTEKWESLEEQTGREGFQDLFSYIRMIFTKKKAKRSLLDEFSHYVSENEISPTELIEDIIEPYADAYIMAKMQGYTSVDKESEKNINVLLKFLNRIDNSDWLPPAILFLSQKKEEPKYVLWFFQKLERLAACLHICSKNINHRIERYAKVMAELEEEHSLERTIENIELSDEEKEAMMVVLNEGIYNNLTAIRRNYVILRLDSFVSEDVATYDAKKLTIEHVLPQSSIRFTKEDNYWVKYWPDLEDRKKWMHRIANLVPLTRQRNAAAQDYSFDDKKNKYFPSKKGVSPYALTSQVLQESEWTPTVLESRQKKMLELFKENWEL